MGFNAGAAGFAEGGMGSEGLLNEGAEQAGVSSSGALEEREAEIDVGEEAAARIRNLLVWGGGEERASQVVPALDGGEGEGLLGFEVVEEGALGEACGAAEVVDGSAGVALFAKDAESGVEEFQLASGEIFRHYVLLLHDSTNRLVWSQCQERRI